MNTKIIFLDLDWTIFGEDSKPMKDSIYCLNELIRLTDAKIVITSSWRIGKNLNQLVAQLSCTHTFPSVHVVGMTDVIYHNELEIPRGAEIEIYLNEHPEIEKYVILDDELIPMLSQADHFVQVNPKIGLSGEGFREALRILG